MTNSAPVRGQIYRVDVGCGPKPWLIVSNNRRNRLWPDVLAARITTTTKHALLPTWVELSPADPLVGNIVTDDLEQIERADLGPLLGTISPGTVMAVNSALKLALAMP
ncbi:mRNA interferase MazF [Nocardia tenerifensis]|uniref:mRNA interferase MazF n=1 Tax=Nocardia tenerifensis TaxID=228006 RepID=A0A318KBF0_9NOCA|nr:type II toxin-antitoxin system PemK/MazF family toxin [Nocardia tenerifensis]PXX62369.1 mRNA interferase MazF [Nocardia tenerifensis]